MDKKAAVRVRARIARIGLGNLGDCELVGRCVFELKLDFGAPPQHASCRSLPGQQLGADAVCRDAPARRRNDLGYPAISEH